MINIHTLRSLFLLVVLPFLVLSACSKSPEFDDREDGRGDKTVVAFEVADGATYAVGDTEDDTISEVDILLFNTRNELINATPIVGVLTQTGLGKAEVKTTLTTIPYGNIVLLANARSMTAGVTFTEKMSYDDAMSLIQLNLPSKWNSDSGSGEYLNIPMYGQTGYVNVSTNNNIFSAELLRMLCRVDVNVVGTAQADFELASVHVYNRETLGMLRPSKVAGEPSMPTTPSKGLTPLVYDGAEITTPNISCEGEIFLMESLIASTVDNKVRLNDALCLLVRGKYIPDGKTYYYRVDFAMDDTGAQAPYPKYFYNLIRNHHYKVNIGAVLGPGEEDPNEALKKETTLINVVVLDWGDGGGIDGAIDGEHVLRLSQGEFTLLSKAHTVADVDNKLTVSSTHPDGWFIEKITDNDGATPLPPGSWLDIDLLDADTPQMTEKMFSLILQENNGTSDRIGYIFIKSGPRMVYQVKVTQKPMTRIRSIEWVDYDGALDGDAQLTSITVEEEDGTTHTSGINSMTVSPMVEARGVIKRVTLTYMGYSLDVPASKWSLNSDQIIVTDRSLIGKPIHLDKIRLDMTGRYLQIADINLSGYTNTNGDPDNWMPIGASSDAFSGSYDGGSGYGDTGFKITNLKIDRGSMDYVGLFGYTTSSSRVTRIHIAEGSSVMGLKYVGAVCGYCLGAISNSSNLASVTARSSSISIVGGVAGQAAEITSCTNNGSVSGVGLYIGGICGKNITDSALEAKVTDCKNLAGGILNTVANSEHVGGVVGSSEGVISNCTNEVAVMGKQYIGGICGSSTVSIQTSHNKATGSVEATATTAYYVGGIVGHGVTIISCTNSATVTGTGSYIGGICGMQIGTPATSIIDDCRNLAGAALITASASRRVGGIVGHSAGTISNCSNAEPVTAESYVGGICGESNTTGSTPGIIRNCNNTVAVEATGTPSYAGGIVGSGSTITGCSNRATIKGVGDHIGGICGFQGGLNTISIISNCITFAETILDTTPTSSHVGGICGRSTGTISECSNESNVSGGQNIGGICGSSINSGRINACDNTGTVKGTTTPNSYVGGIAGTGSTVYYCVNTATVTGAGAYVGGIHGGGTSNLIRSCYNLGAVTGTDNVNAIGLSRGSSLAFCFFGEGANNFSDTQGSTKFGAGETEWPVDTMFGWGVYPADPTGAWTSLGGWNGGINPLYPVLKQ